MYGGRRSSEGQSRGWQSSVSRAGQRRKAGSGDASPIADLPQLCRWKTSIPIGKNPTGNPHPGRPYRFVKLLSIPDSSVSSTLEVNDEQREIKAVMQGWQRTEQLGCRWSPFAAGAPSVERLREALPTPTPWTAAPHCYKAPARAALWTGIGDSQPHGPSEPPWIRTHSTGQWEQPPVARSHRPQLCPLWGLAAVSFLSDGLR